MIPVRLRLQGFLSYRHPAELDFSLFSLACISGPNGAGKSTLLDALTWALFGQARRRDDAIIHTAADAASVTFEFELAGERYRVQRAKARGKPQLLELHQWDPDRRAWRALSERRLRDTQAKIENILGLDYRTFVHASFFLQGQADNFARQTPAERKETLARVLDLQQWEMFHERAREHRRTAESALQRLDAEMAEARQVLARREELLAQHAQLEAELENLAQRRQQIEEGLRAAEALRAQVEAAHQRVEEVRQAVVQAEAEVEHAQRQCTQIQAELEQLDALLARAEDIHAAEQQRRALQSQLSEWSQKAHRYRELQAQLAQTQTAYREARARLEQERRDLERQRLEAQAAHERLQAVEASIADLQAQLEALPSTDVDAVNARLQKLAAEEAQLRAENDDLRATMNELKDRLERLRQATGATCPLCGQELTEEHRTTLIARLEEEGKTLAERYRANKERLTQLAKERRDLQQALQQARRAQSEHQRLSQALAKLQAQRDSLQTTWKNWQLQAAPRLEEVARLLDADSFAPELRQRLDELLSALEALAYDPQIHAQVEAQLKALADTESDAQRLAQAQARHEALEARLADWRLHLQQAQQRHQRLLDEWTRAQDEAQRLQQAIPDLDNLQDQWHRTVNLERQRQQDLGAVQQQLAFVAETEERLQRLEARREALVRRIAHYREVELACSKKGVPALLIEQALPHLEAEANELLARLTDGEMHLSFRTQAAYKDPKRKDTRETLDIIVSDPHGERPYETFSGGEAFRINFAIRLALARMLARRAGAQVQLLVIDEGFGSQDEIGRQRLVEAINRVRDQFSHILVITHIAELRDRFPVRIEVEKTAADGSRLRLVGV